MELVKDSVFNYHLDIESDLIDIKTYFDDYSKLIKLVDACENVNCKDSIHSHDNCKTDEFYRNYLGISQIELDELKKKTSIDCLTSEEEVKAKPKNPCMEEETNNLCLVTENVTSPLVSVNKRLEMDQIVKTNFPRTYYKYCNYEWCISNVQTRLDFDNIVFPTIVACVKVYNPFMSYKSTALKFKMLQEIHILGDQTLAMLKDKISCSHDYIGDVDVSNDIFLKDVGVNIPTKDEYPSSFIFIEDTFYNDTRSEKMIDLSEELRKWASTKGIGNFKTGIMENTKIKDLKLKIGRPYVYQHVGNCEHLIVFSDLRLWNPSDPTKFNSFPRNNCIGRTYGKHCMMCSDIYARWLVVGNERLTHDKTFLCNKCFISYNYVNGKKVGNFEAYKYVDPVAIL